MVNRLVQRYNGLVRMMRICSAICGADITAPGYRMNILTWIVIGSINLFLVFTVYTIYINIYVENDMANMLQALSMVGSCLQGYCKLLNVIKNKQNISFFIDELRLIYEEFDSKHSDYRVALHKSMNSVSKAIKSIAIMYAVATSTVILLVPYYRFVLDQRTFVMQFLLPGIDPQTEFGYILMNFNHCVCILFGAFGNFAGDMYYFNFISHVPLLKDILTCKMHDLNDILDDANQNANASNALLKDIFQWHQKYMNFITVVKETYFWVILVEICTIALCIALTLFCILLGRWPGGYIYLIYCFVILYLYCGLGTLVEISNDGFIDSCYNDIIWYKMSIPQQKMLRIMIMMTQNTTGITVGAIMPLSMSTGLQVTKAIYTWTMMLINFLN